MRMIMLMANQHALTRAPHAIRLVMFLQPFQAREHAGIFLGLRLLGAERVVGQRVQADCLGLFGGEVVGSDGTVFVL